MAQSKLKTIPLELAINFGRSYSLALVNQPILVKSITSGFLAVLGNLIGQKLENCKQSKRKLSKWKLNWQSVIAYAIFGCFVNGPITHFYLNLLEKYGPKNSFVKLFIDRLIYGPAFLYLTLNLLNILQGQGLEKTRQHVKRIYCNTLKANLKIWTICQYINLNFVPLEYRSLVGNLVSLFWNIYLSGIKKCPEESDTKKLQPSLPKIGKDGE